MSNIAIEHGPVEIVDFPMKNGGSFHSYVNVYQRLSKVDVAFPPRETPDVSFQMLCLSCCRGKGPTRRIAAKNRSGPGIPITLSHNINISIPLLITY